MRLTATEPSSLDDFLDKVTSRESILHRNLASFIQSNQKEQQQTQEVIFQLSAHLAHHKALLADVQLNNRALADELAEARDQICALRGKLKFSDARGAGLLHDVNTRRSLAAVQQRRLAEQLAAVQTELKILTTIKHTSSFYFVT
jgi:hypothetical protein